MDKSRNAIRPRFKLLTDQTAVNNAKYVIQPLLRGLGTTLGNALRRTILGAVPGSAVIGYRIKGYNHEYTTVPGVLETLLQISLNLKSLLVRMDAQVFDQQAVVTLTLNKQFKKGSERVTGADIVCPAGVEIVNPQFLLCHLAPAGQLSMEMFCKIQTGFCFASTNRKWKSVSDMIAIDSKHSPVESVAYNTHPVKMGGDEALEALTLAVTTNGVATASDVIAVAAQTLIDQLTFLVDLKQTLLKQKLSDGDVDDTADLLDTSVFDLELTQRSENCLIGSGIRTLRELVSQSEAEIKAVKSLGKKSFEEIKNKVLELKLTFATADER